MEFFVTGTPVAQGSKVIRYRGKYPALADDNANTLKPWRRRIALIAATEMRGQPLLEGEVQMRLVFYLYRPKHVPKSGPTAAKKPDNDKLQRAVFDALTGVVFRDDCQVVDVWSRKCVAEPGQPLGVRVAVRPAQAAG